MVLTTLLADAIPGFTLAASAVPGQFAEQQLRQITILFPGHMSGNPAKLMAVDCLQQQFTQLGYQSNTHQRNTHYD